MSTACAVLLGLFLAVPAILFCTTRGIFPADCNEPREAPK